MRTNLGDERIPAFAKLTDLGDALQRADAMNALPAALSHLLESGTPKQNVAAQQHAGGDLKRKHGQQIRHINQAAHDGVAP